MIHIDINTVSLSVKEAYQPGKMTLHSTCSLFICGIFLSHVPLFLDIHRTCGTDIGMLGAGGFENPQIRGELFLTFSD